MIQYNNNYKVLLFLCYYYSDIIIILFGILLFSLISSYIFIDPTLTVANVTMVIMKTKSDWNHELGSNLLVPYSVLEKIIENHSFDVNAQKKAMVEYWVGTLYNASWSTLAGVLHFFNEREALTLCKEFLNAECGMFKLQCNVQIIVLYRGTLEVIVAEILEDHTYYMYFKGLHFT